MLRVRISEDKMDLKLSLSYLEGSPMGLGLCLACSSLGSGLGSGALGTGCASPVLGFVICGRCPSSTTPLAAAAWAFTYLSTTPVEHVVQNAFKIHHTELAVD